jgi:hypothetical protein
LSGIVEPETLTLITNAYLEQIADAVKATTGMSTNSWAMQ